MNLIVHFTKQGLEDTLVESAIVDLLIEVLLSHPEVAEM